jgi:pimeloyl-ACP methyl ester carboxylesterase
MVFPDLPGFGYSPKPIVVYTIDLFVNSLRAFLAEQRLADRPLHIVAHSLGALIALEYASRYPLSVQRLVLLSLPRFPDPMSARRIFGDGSPSYRKLVQRHSLRANLAQLRRTGLFPALLNAWGIPLQVLLDCRRFTFQSLTSTLENCLLSHSVEPSLRGMPPRPTLLIHGERDQVAPYDVVALLPHQYGHMEIRSFRSGGHHVLHSHPRGCVSLIRAHLEDGAGAPTGRPPRRSSDG